MVELGCEVGKYNTLQQQRKWWWWPRGCAARESRAKYQGYKSGRAGTRTKTRASKQQAKSSSCCSPVELWVNGMGGAHREACRESEARWGGACG